MILKDKIKYQHFTHFLLPVFCHILQVLQCTCGHSATPKHSLEGHKSFPLLVVVVVVVVVLTFTRITKSVVPGQASSSQPVVEEHPRENTQTHRRWCTHISQLTQFMPPPETSEIEIGSQSTMCRCIRLITHAWRNRLHRLTPKKNYHLYITRSTYHYA